jgi:hypothetical protein
MAVHSVLRKLVVAACGGSSNETTISLPDLIKYTSTVYCKTSPEDGREIRISKVLCLLLDLVAVPCCQISINVVYPAASVFAVSSLIWLS